MKRLSNGELIRIVAMVFIVIYHIVLHGTGGKACGANLIYGITVTGVNLFILISGYFNIRLSWKSLLNMYLMVFFYTLISIIFSHVVMGRTISIDNFIELFFPMSRKSGCYWFVSCYFMLMLLSPIINIYLHRSSEKEYFWGLGMCIYLSCFSGWIFNNSINFSGLNVFHFVFMYMLGDFLRRYDVVHKLKQKYWLLIYIIATLLFPLLVSISISKTLRYNNPFIIIASISLFLFIISFQFNSKLINRIAKYMFPVYLLQEGYIGLSIYGILKDYGLQMNFEGMDYWKMIVCYFIGLFVVAFIIECVRRKMQSALVDFISSILVRRFPLFEKVNDDSK